ncbi:MAG TPA: winged helix-turn-helix domain-containing protein [Candidatus Limiplasma sp.]|nr:winged helix-turn-helix domain-containing protein [Candidatus Limiplasma sp.]HRX08387.1 winged helix-turn-helix domain-containing protein [Candidatus Limiplasma sp.]
MIYIVEDDTGVRELELYALKQAGFEVEGFVNAASFRTAIKQKLPSLVLLDVMLPGEDGVTLLQSLRREPRTKRLPIILVTAKGTEMDKVRGLDAGADDYLSKPFGVMELLARVKALLRRSEDVKTEAVITVGSLTLDRERHLVLADDVTVELTHMEFELLSFLMTHAGKAVTRNMLLDDVWGLNYAGDTRTVDVHIRSLRLKLNRCGEMIHTVRGVGYKLEETP